MNDLLTRMVQRQRGEVATVQPRVPPMFAPVAEPAPASLSEEMTWTRPTTMQAPEPTTPERTEDLVRPSKEERAQFTPPPLPMVNHVVDMQPLVDSVQRVASSEASESEFHPQAIRPIREEHRSNSEETVVSLSEAIERQTASHVTPQHPQVVREQHTRTERAEVISRLVRQESPPVLASVAPPSLVTAPRAEGLMDRMSQDGSEPPIQVTIGSIEVTAVAAAPAPKRKTAARQPAMSLQDYLARRQGKGVPS